MLIFLYVTLYFRHSPPDATHPYGYGKYETIGSLAVSSLLMIGAVGIGHHSYEILINLFPSEIPNSINELGGAINLQTDENHQLNPNAAWFAAASVIIKEALFRITLKIGLEERSNVLVANAWHHRSDAASSVVALGAIVGSYLGFPFLDPLGGMLVAGMIMKSGFEIMLDSLKELVDIRVEQEVINQVEKAVEKLKGTDPNIVNFHSIRGRKSGPFYLIDMILQVNPDLTISKAHNIEEQVRQAVKKECKSVKEVLMHLDVEDQCPHH
ncbi:2027_t:CDS:2 [Funneliformis caledonium]|uniref:2027_t:CDS:1 n=1 Tax=Funneliformis caledonium TaxID=1117310 RepID=A0A9N9CNW4_9GLOM|nr:2027_t:CDS:2 [Funneliformis caledonium]